MKIKRVGTIILFLLLAGNSLLLIKNQQRIDKREEVTQMDHKNMSVAQYLKFLKDDIHSTVFSTVDEQGKPESRIIDMMLLKGDKLYFLTATTKPFYDELLAHPDVAITGVKGKDTMSSVSISVKGTVREIGTKYLDEIFEKNAYMNQIYPTPASKKVLRVFEVYRGSVEVYDLRTKPIYQTTLVIK